MTPLPTVAALCVSARSEYKSLDGVVCYDLARDVRTFTGGMPVICHPPCRAWSLYTRHQAKPPPGEKELGPLCASWLRECGGVLEHPARSLLFQAADLPLPGCRVGDLWSIYIEQHWWGHTGTAKRTWLCFSRIDPRAITIPFRLRNPGGDKRLWNTMPRFLRSHTCESLAAWLVSAARLAA